MYDIQTYTSDSIRPNNDLVAPFSVLLLILRYIDQLGDGDSVQVTESLQEISMKLGLGKHRAEPVAGPGLHKPRPNFTNTGKKLTFAIAPSGSFPSHLSSTF